MQKQIDKRVSNFSGTFRQQGQAFIVTLAFAAITAIVVVLMFNSSQASNEKTKLVNAADAAAYSGGVWTARQLNFMAYTNRAMMTNHVMVGHFVAYSSWAEYAADTIQNIDTVTRYIPYLGQAVSALRTVSDSLHQVNESVGPGFVRAVDGMNSFLSGAQTDAHRALIGLGGSGQTPVQQIMKETAKAYSPNIEINSLSGAGENTVKAFHNAKILGQQYEINSFVKRYNPQRNDAGVQRMDYMVRNSISKSRSWLNVNPNLRDRGSRVRKFKAPLGIVKFRKEATNTNGLQSWESSDRLRYKTWGMKKYKTISSGSAKATDFDPGYRGMRSFFGLADNPKQSDPQVKKSLFVSAYATMPMSELSLNSTMEMTTDAPEMASMSTAEVYHERGNATYFRQLAGNGEEYANISNPFWQVRLKGKGASTDGTNNGGGNGGYTPGGPGTGYPSNPSNPSNPYNPEPRPTPTGPIDTFIP